MRRARLGGRAWPQAFGEAVACAAALWLAGCAALPRPAPRAEIEAPTAEPERCASEIVSAAPALDSARLERELARLRDDLRAAESTMARIESGEPGRDADAVSAIAEARIALARATDVAPWRARDLDEVRRRLDAAERQLRADHRATATFLASLARRDAVAVREEGQLVASARNARFVRGSRVRLRAGPSTDHAILELLGPETPVFTERPEGDWLLVTTLTGRRGWVHGGLLR